jgi:molybdopterin-binding protein
MAMKSVGFLLFALFCLMAIAAQEGGQQMIVKKALAPKAVCDAAAAKLRDSGTSNIYLIMTLDTKGRVESFTTESPQDLRLEKMKEATAAIKAIQFEAAKKDGRPVRVLIKVEFDCSVPAADASRNP